MQSYLSNNVNITPKSKRKSPAPRCSTTPIIRRKRCLSKREMMARLSKKDKEIEKLKEQLEIANSKCQRIQKENKCLKLKNSYLEFSKKKLTTENEILNKKVFNYDKLVLKESQFNFLCGLSVEKFNMLFEIVSPFTDAIIYPDCKGTGKRIFDKKTELFMYLTVCRHSLHLGVMSYMSDVSKSTVYRIFVGWAVFLETLFNQLDLKPNDGYLLKKMPDIFVRTGHGLTDIVIDCTEFKFQNATNLDLNSLMFSNYKNSLTGKALIGISPHGSGLLFSDIYPGSISDTEITEKSCVLDWIRSEHEVMSDRGFCIQEQCAIKGIFLNRPAQKSNPQFCDAEISANFDISSCRIHVERFIGCVRDWDILNSVWPLQRMDILSSVWQSLCHIVNITSPPIGPKEV